MIAISIVNGYLTLAEAKSALDIGDTADDTHIELAIEAASRAIDDWTSRRFYTTAETRYYTAQVAHRLRVDDLLTVDTLKTDTSGTGTFSTVLSDFDLAPYNAAADGRPYTNIELTSSTFPATRRGVEIVGTFGWPALPTAIKQACEIQAQVIFKRVTEGAAPIVTMDGTTLQGGSKFLDRGAQLLLQPYRAPVVA